MREFFKSKLFKILLVVKACLFGLIAFEIFSDDATIFKSAMRTAIQPLIKATNFVNDSVSGFFDNIFKHEIYAEENVLLKKELAKVRKNLIELDKLKNENDQLRKVLDFKQEHKNYDIEVANFVSRDPDSIYNFTIDIGSNKNVAIGATVMTNTGLVGKIVKVSNNQSTVATILDFDEQIPAAINLKQEKGIIYSDPHLVKQGFCLMSHLPKITKAAPGDLIYTSGTSNAYPDGIIIGTIVEVKLNKNGISREAIIKPAQDLNSIKEVMVLKGLRSK